MYMNGKEINHKFTYSISRIIQVYQLINIYHFKDISRDNQQNFST
jgi:hypothetical protein